MIVRADGFCCSFIMSDCSIGHNNESRRASLEGVFFTLFLHDTLQSSSVVHIRLGLLNLLLFLLQLLLLQLLFLFLFLFSCCADVVIALLPSPLASSLAVANQA